MDRMHTRRAVVCGLALWTLAGFSGCGKTFEGKDDLVAALHQSCRRVQSRITPDRVRLRELYEIATPPQSVEQVDEQRQRWHYKFPDGGVEFVVMLEPGHQWTDENPRVFVNLREIRTF